MILFLDFSQRTLTKKSVFQLLRLHLQAKNRPAATTSAFLLMTICDGNCKHTHPSYVHNLSSCKNEAWKNKKNGDSTNSRPTQNKLSNQKNLCKDPKLWSSRKGG